MDIFSLKWFVVGILISAPLHWFYVSIRSKVSKMQFEDKLATNTIVRTLGLAIVVGGFAFSIYGNYLTARAGEGTMSQAEFKVLVDQFAYGFRLYVAFLWALVGIATGTGLVLMFRSAWRYFSHRHSNLERQDNFETTVSTKEMESIVKRRDDYNKVKTKVDEFLNKLSNENKEVQNELQQTKTDTGEKGKDGHESR